MAGAPRPERPDCHPAERSGGAATAKDLPRRCGRDDPSRLLRFALRFAPGLRMAGEEPNTTPAGRMARGRRTPGADAAIEPAGGDWYTWGCSGCSAAW